MVGTGAGSRSDTDGSAGVPPRDTSDGEPTEAEGEDRETVGEEPRQTESQDPAEVPSEPTGGETSQGGDEAQTPADTREPEPTESGEASREPPVVGADTAEPATDASDGGEPEATETQEVSTDETGTAPPSETIPVPEGCIPIRRLDMSMTQRGVGYVLHTGGRLPSALRSPAFSADGGMPTVLIVNTHPYEGYSQGDGWYDPAAGSLAVTDTPNHPEGVVALGNTLARRLREQGFTVIHLRVAVSAGDRTDEIYDRVERAVEDYLRLYPDIGLVLDLGRSAELTEDGGILQTAGMSNGVPCAQLGLKVSGGRGESAVAADLAAALYLRRVLWEAEPTLSRPVEIRGGGGLAANFEGVRFLTLELGSAGNTYGEAAALLPAFADAIGSLLSDSQNYG